MDRGYIGTNYCISSKSEQMNKFVCIYPQDATTNFLSPLCDHICKIFEAVKVGYDINGDEDPIEQIYKEIQDTQIIFFLGHGMSSCLYASILDNVELFNKDNINILKNKRLFLLACNSNQFIKKFSLTNSIGFGFLPTSEDDIRQTKAYHYINISNTGEVDFNSFNNALVQCLINTLSKDTIEDFHLLKERLFFYLSKEIVNCLIDKSSPNYRIVADELFFMYKDMVIK